MLNRLMLGCLVSSFILLAAKPELSWEPGKVDDPVDARLKLAAQPARTSPHHHIDFDPHLVVIEGRGLTLVAEERHSWHGWCMLIEGDQVKYAKDAHGLHVRDSSGKECTFAVLQENKK